MHPVSYLFEEIYRDYWGIPATERGRERKKWHRPRDGRGETRR